MTGPRVQTRAEVEARVRGFLTRLHSKLASRGRCFSSGAFVVHIPQSSTQFQRFLDGLLAHSSARFGAKTHDDFQVLAKLRARRLCRPACARDITALRPGRQREFIFGAPLAGLCGPADASAKRVLLFYTFQTNSGAYLYMKLESEPALSVGHAVSALSRYVLKKSKKSQFAARRENAYKNKRGVAARTAMALSSADVRELWPEQAKNSKEYDASLRIGYEFFVPAAAAVRLL